MGNANVGIKPVSCVQYSLSIGLVYEGHQSRCYSFQGLVMTPVISPALQGVLQLFRM